MGTYDDTYKKLRKQGKSVQEAEAGASKKSREARAKQSSKAVKATMGSVPATGARVRQEFHQPNDLEARAARGQAPTAAQAAAAKKAQAKLDDAQQYIQGRKVARERLEGKRSQMTGTEYAHAVDSEARKIAAQSRVQANVESKMRAQETATAQVKNLPDPVKAAATQKKVAPDISSTVRKLDSDFRESMFRSDDPETHRMGVGDIPPDRLKKELAYSRKHGYADVTVKIPSLSEFSMSVESAAALDARNDGISQSEFERREIRVKANAPDARQIARARLEEKVREEANSDTRRWGKTPKEDARLEAAQKRAYEAKTPYERLNANVDLRNAADARDRAQDAVVEKIVRSKLAEFDMITKTEAMDPDNVEKQKEGAKPGENKPKRELSEKQKASLAKAHAAVRAKHAERKEMAAAMGGVGGSGMDQPRVPGGNPKGGQFANKG
jgi:hypothetical protein